jgi:hypothetical protein
VQEEVGDAAGCGGSGEEVADLFCKLSCTSDGGLGVPVCASW